jgi:cytochrome c-type biogenesis protein
MQNNRRLFTLFACCVLSACTERSGNAAGDSSNAVRRAEVGKQVPVYGAQALNGGADSLHLLRGKVVLLNVWATWCIPCRTELPDLQALHERYNQRGLVIVGVSIDEGNDASRVSAFAKERGVTYSLWHDPADRVSSLFLANGVPATYLIGRDGKLRWRWLGPLTNDDVQLNSELTAALDENP